MKKWNGDFLLLMVDFLIWSKNHCVSHHCPMFLHLLPIWLIRDDLLVDKFGIEAMELFGCVACKKAAGGRGLVDDPCPCDAVGCEVALGHLEESIEEQLLM